MIQARRVSIVLQDPAAMDAGADPADWGSRAWQAPSDPATGAALKDRNDAAAVRIMADVAGLERTPPSYDLVNDWVRDQGMAEDAAMARLHRLVLLNDRAPPGALGIEIADNIAVVVGVVRNDQGSAEWDDVTARFVSAAESVAAATGFHPVDGASSTLQPPEQAGALAAAVIGQPVAELRRKAGLNWVWFLLGQLIIAALVIGIGVSAINRSLLIHDVNAEQPLSFVVHGQLPAEYRLGVFPRFSLAGVVRESGVPARLGVFRDVWITTQRGSTLMVFATGRSDEPLLSVDDYAGMAPLFRIGQWPVEWVSILAVGLLLLWLGWALFGYALKPPARRRSIRANSFGLVRYAIGIVVAVAAVIVVRRYL